MSPLKNYLELSQGSKMLHEGRKGKGAGLCPKIWVFSCFAGSESLKKTPCGFILSSYGSIHMGWAIYADRCSLDRKPLGEPQEPLWGWQGHPCPWRSTAPLFSSFSMAPPTCLQIPPGIPRMVQLLRDQHSSSKDAGFSWKPLGDTLLCPISWKGSRRPWTLSPLGLGVGAEGQLLSFLFVHKLENSHF